MSSAPHQKKPYTPDLNHFTVEEWELPKEEFTLEEELGSGCFADVYRGRWKNHINVAIKIIKSGTASRRRSGDMPKLRPRRKRARGLWDSSQRNAGSIRGVKQTQVGLRFTGVHGLVRQAAVNSLSPVSTQVCPRESLP